MRTPAKLACTLLSLTLAQILLAQETTADRSFFFAQKLYDDKLYKLAAEQFSDFARKYQSHQKADDALFLSADASFRNADYLQAFNTYKELEILYPQSSFLAESRFRLAECQMSLKNFEAAAELFKRVPVFHQESDKAPVALRKAAKAYLKTGKPKPALSSLFNLISLYPDSPERITAHLQIVETYLSIGNYDDALSQVDKVFRVFGAEVKDPRIYLLRAQIFEEMGQYEVAREVYLNIVNKFPDSDQAKKVRYHLGNLFRKQGNDTEALEYYEQFVADSKPSRLIPKAYVDIGDIYLAKGEFESALENYRQADELADDSLRNEANYKIGAVLSRLGKLDQAVDRLNKVIHSGQSGGSLPYLEESFIKMAEVLASLGRPKQALDTILEYKHRFSDSQNAARILFEQADLLENHLQEFSQALRVYQEYIERFAHSPTIDDAQLGIARCYEKLGDYNLARVEYKKHLDLYPGADNSAWARQRMRLIDDTVFLEDEKGLDDFSELLGKFVSQPPGENWSLELGKFYFKIRNFRRAIAVLQGIIAAPTNGYDKAEVLYSLGRAYYRSAQKNLLIDEGATYREKLDSAYVYLNRIPTLNPDFMHIEEVEYLLTEMALDTVALPGLKQQKLVDRCAEWQQKYPTGIFLADVLVQSADLFYQNSNGQDSTQLRTAQAYYGEIKKNNPESEYVAKASYYVAEILYHLGEDSTALADVSSFIQLHPQSGYFPKALLLKAQLERRLGNSEAAVATLQQIKSDYFYTPVFPRSQVVLAEIRFSNRDYRSALEIYDKFDADFIQNSGEIGYRRAQALEKSGEDSRALEAYLRFIKENPRDTKIPEASLSVARLAQKQGRVAFARNYYEHLAAVARRPVYKFQAHIALGDIYFGQGLNGDARKQYLAAEHFATSPDQERYSASQAIRCQIQQNKFAQADLAIKDFKKKFSKTDREEGQFLLDKANAYLDTKDFELAEKAFKKLRRDNKGTEFEAQGDFGVGAVYLVSKHTDDALKILTAIPSKYPDSEVTALTYFNLGDFYYKSQQIENAVSAFKNVLDHPKSGEYSEKAHLYLIQCYKDLRLWDQAIASTRGFLQAFPHSEQHFRKKIDLAQFLMNLKEYVRAIEEFKKLLQSSDPESEAEIQFYIAQSYKEMGDFERAASEFLKVRYLTRPSKLPWHVTALFEAGRSLIRLNEIEAARTVFQRIIKEEGAESNFGRFALKQLEEMDSKQKDSPPKDGTSY